MSISVAVAVFIFYTICMFFVGKIHSEIKQAEQVKPQLETYYKKGYEQGIKDSEKFIVETINTIYRQIEEQLNKQGLTLGEKYQKKSDRDQKIEAALQQQRARLQPKQTPKLRLIKKPELTMVKGDEKQ
jgi:hypothetical protein